jgi:putative colanic acid biosynthesis UDP-glucose lipid carrier transferase
VVTSYFFGFYKVYRYSRPFSLLGLLLKQFLIFFLGYFTYFGVFREGTVVNNQFIILVIITLSISIVKFLWFILLNKYRSFGNNSRTTIVVGFDDSSQNIIRLFKSKANLGYSFLGYFSSKVSENKEYLGSLEDCFSVCC